MKPVNELEKDARTLDLVLLKIPAVVQMCVSTSGNDYAVGFYEGVKEGHVYLNRLQKCAFEETEADKYPLADVEEYEILRRYEPDPEDGIDQILAQTLEDTE